MTAEQALQKLKEGNKRFVEGKSRHQLEPAEARASLIQGQHPFTIILGCSDARVPVEYIFDQGFDDLFVIRVAGNVAGQNALASIQYAALHAHVPLIVVLGHTFCGAVTVALAPQEQRAEQTPEIQQLLQQIDPALAQVETFRPLAERVELGVQVNVRYVVHKLETNNALRPLVQNGQLNIVGAVYDLKSGVVNFLPT